MFCLVGLPGWLVFISVLLLLVVVGLSVCFVVWF